EMRPHACLSRRTLAPAAFGVACGEAIFSSRRRGSHHYSQKNTREYGERETGTATECGAHGDSRAALYGMPKPSSTSRASSRERARAQTQFTRESFSFSQCITFRTNIRGLLRRGMKAETIAFALLSCDCEWHGSRRRPCGRG